MLTDLISVGGVKDTGSDNHFKVSQRAAGANMSVDVAAGRAYVLGTDCYPVRSTDIVNQAIASNSSGNPRIDAIVLYIDKSASPTTSADNVAKITVVNGTPAASPAAPTDSAIQTALGASNPFIRLANVTVANGAASIVNANIADARTPFRVRVNIGDDATGDIYYRDSDGKVSRLAIGTDGQVLSVVSSLPAWINSTPIGCILHRSTVQSIPNSAWTEIQWNVEDYDSHGFHSTSLNTDQIVIPAGQAGFYAMGWGVQFTTNTTGYRSVKTTVNGSDGPYPANRGHDNITGDQSALPGSTPLIHFNEGDVIRVPVFQTSGGALNVNTDNTFFSLVKVG